MSVSGSEVAGFEVGSGDRASRSERSRLCTSKGVIDAGELEGGVVRERDGKEDGRSLPVKGSFAFAGGSSGSDKTVKTSSEERHECEREVASAALERRSDGTTASITAGVTLPSRWGSSKVVNDVEVPDAAAVKGACEFEEFTSDSDSFEICGEDDGTISSLGDVSLVSALKDLSSCEVTPASKSD